ncbi:MAG: histidine ammonia-lyase [Phycisphaerales bacterium]|nr:histidine ammonia-lyase [Phycisphaerales bacterium]
MPPAHASRAITLQPLVLDGGPLSIVDVESVARPSHGGGLRPVRLAAAAKQKLTASHAALSASLSAGAAVYGVNTGFGSLARRRIGEAQLEDVQRNLLRSHASGVGPPMGEDVVRGMLLLLAASLCRGLSGVRPGVVNAIVALLNARTDRGGAVTPVVPEVGSVGASGDLAPLAHACLVLLGEGEATADGRRISGAEALRLAGVAPLGLGPKEGLALINGTHLMGAQACLALDDFERVFDAAVAAAAMSIDALRATDTFLDPRVFVARNQPGPALVAARMRGMLAGSQVLTSHPASVDPRVQDPYSVRCAPPILGATYDAARYVRGCVEAELGAVTDNPLVFPAAPGAAGADQWAQMARSGGVVSAGNFHGMPLAIPLDVLMLSLSHVAGVSERRTFLLLAAGGGFDPEARLPAHLTPQPGVQSGYMITQYTAAACCNELIGLATPASVANLSTCAGQEDYNSFGPRAAAKARRGIALARSVVAIELLCAAEGLEYHRPLRSGHGVEETFAAVRSTVPRLTVDRPPSPDIAAIEAMISEGRFGL